MDCYCLVIGNSKKERFDKQVIDSAFKSIVESKTDNLNVHFVYAGIYYRKHEDALRSLILEKMKNYKIKEVMVTIICMSRRNLMQNLVILMEPSKDLTMISLKGGNMCLNRFCIDEDAQFELSGVHYLTSSDDIIQSRTQRKSKGKGYTTLTGNSKSRDQSLYNIIFIISYIIYII